MLNSPFVRHFPALNSLTVTLPPTPPNGTEQAASLLSFRPRNALKHSTIAPFPLFLNGEGDPTGVTIPTSPARSRPVQYCI